MKKIDYLFNVLNEIYSPLNLEKVIKTLATIENHFNGKQRIQAKPKPDWELMFIEAKEEIKELIISSQKNESYLVRYTTQKILSFKKLLDENFKQRPLKELLKLQDKGNCTFLFHDFVNWYESEIIFSKLEDSTNQSIKTSLFFDEKKPTKNLDEMIWKYEGLFQNSKFKKNISKLHELFNTYYRKEDLLNTSHRAIQEIKYLIPNSNFNNVANSYLKKVNELICSFEELESNNDLKNINNLGLSYHKTLAPLIKFKHEVSELLGLNQKRTSTNKTFEQFNTEIFKDLESYKLFLFLVDEYAVNKSVTQFSQIYHWLRTNDNRIKNGRGVKYKEFVKITFKIDDKFSRISEFIHNENVTLNDIFKRFQADK